MTDELVSHLDPQPGQVLVDGTLGGGGHARLLAERVGPEGRVLAIDRDPKAVSTATARFAQSARHMTVLQANYRDLPVVLAEVNIAAVDGVVLDLGLSSDQLADAERGFSFDAEGPLDLRYDNNHGESAAVLVNRWSEKRLANLIYEFGEERYSRRIARRIVEARRQQPIQTATQLAALVRRSVPRRGRPQRIDPATRTFQALRIAVNQELDCLDDVLKCLPECLRPGGRVAVISFHSLEDRRVKEAFRDNALYEVITKKPLRPTAEEVSRNPRSRSARMRVAQRRTG